jgi:hypothetical protein
MRQLAVVVTVLAAFAGAAGGAQVQLPDQLAGGRGAASGRGLPPATGTGLLMGQVVDGSTGRAVPEAIVSLSGGGGRGVAPGRGFGEPTSSRVMVDGQGRFVFRDLPAGSFRINATKVGHFGGASGQRSPSGPSRPVELADGERRGDVTLRLWRHGTITGTVVDQSGAPVVGIGAQLLRRSAVNGQWRFVIAGSTETDDRGAYRFGTITPGAYVVSVRSAGGLLGERERLMVSLLMADEASLMRMMSKASDREDESLLVDRNVRVYMPAFYPAAASSSQASIITVASGAERSGVDFRVKTVATSTVVGTVTGIPADSFVSLQLRAIDAESTDEPVAGSSATPPNGRFLMAGVPPGQYVLQAEATQNMSAQVQADARGRGGRGMPLPPAPAAPTLSASVPVTIGDRDIPDLAVALRPGGRVIGHIQFEGSAERPAPEQLNQISVTLTPFVQTHYRSMIQPGRIEADGTFRTASVAPGRYLLVVGAVALGGAGSAATGPRGGGAGSIVWRARAAMIDGRDMLDQPIDIDAADIDVVLTLTDQPWTTLSGTVRDAKSMSDPEATILVFPTDNRLWSDLSPSARRVRAARTTRAGAYTISGLLPGEYFVIARPDDMLIDWQAPGRLQSLASLAARVQVNGRVQALDLKSGGK